MTLTQQTPYGPIGAELYERLSEIRLLALDVDGIFSDGRIYMGNQGEELKAFHTLDGYGIKAVLKAGIEVAVITGRRSTIVEQRMTALGVPHIVQGCEGKAQALQDLMAQLGTSSEAVASMGDDMPDLGMFEHSAVRFSVPHAHPIVAQQADYITTRHGGFGAVREVCDLFLQRHGRLESIQGTSV